VYQKFLEIDVSSTSRLRGVFSEDRKVLRHSMERPFGLELRTERQLGPETLYLAQPQKMAVCAKVAFSACTAPLITALGAFDKL
jgi:hypothetical protein